MEIQEQQKIVALTIYSRSIVVLQSFLWKYVTRLEQVKRLMVSENFAHNSTESFIVYALAKKILNSIDSALRPQRYT